MSSAKNCISYWWPKLRAARVPTPRTSIVRTRCDLLMLLDSKTPDGFISFVAEIQAAASELRCHDSGGLFLRTGQGSGKHNWSETCFLPDTSIETLCRHIAALVEWSEMVDMMGLPYDVWAVRELLPTEPVAILPRYGGFPLVPEVRAFIEGGEVVCHHPYWPRQSIEQGFPLAPSKLENETGGIITADVLAEWQDLAYELPANFEEIVSAAQTFDDGWRMIAKWAAKVFRDDGAWSVDLLPTRRGWYVTDMALAAESFHWPECEHNVKDK